MNVSVAVAEFGEVGAADGDGIVPGAPDDEGDEVGREEPVVAVPEIDGPGTLHCDEIVTLAGQHLLDVPRRDHEVSPEPASTNSAATRDCVPCCSSEPNAIRS